MHKISSEIKKLVGQTFRNRGASYFKNGAVSEISVNEYELEIIFTVEVKWSHNNYYESIITINKNDITDIAVECTCHAYNDYHACKHIAALARKIDLDIDLDELFGPDSMSLLNKLENKIFDDDVVISLEKLWVNIPEYMIKNYNEQKGKSQWLLCLELLSQSEEVKTTKNNEEKLYKVKLNFYTDRQDIYVDIFKCKVQKNGQLSSWRKITSTYNLPQKYENIALDGYHRYYYVNAQNSFRSNPKEIIKVLQWEQTIYDYGNNSEITRDKTIHDLKLFVKYLDSDQYEITAKIKKWEEYIDLDSSQLYGGSDDWYWALRKNRAKNLFIFQTELPKEFIVEIASWLLVLSWKEFEQFKDTTWFDVLLSNCGWLKNMDKQIQNYLPKEIITLGFSEDYSTIQSELKFYYDDNKNKQVSINDFKYFLKWDDTRNYIKSLDGKIIQRDFSKEMIIFQKYRDFFTNLFDIHDRTNYIFEKRVDDNIELFFESIDKIIDNWTEIHYMQLTKKFSTKPVSVSINIKSGLDRFDAEVDVEVWGEKIEESELILEALSTWQKAITLKSWMTLLLQNDLNISGENINKELAELGLNTRNISQKQKIPKHNIWLLQNIKNTSIINFSLDKEVTKLKTQLKQFSGIKNIAIPKSFKAELRNYQIIGYNRLNFLQKYNFWGILADDMGLGKTIQTIALLTKVYEKTKIKTQSLIVCPTSLTLNRYDELVKFAPDLKIARINTGKDSFKDIPKDTQIILVSYWIIANMVKWWFKKSFHYVILDESQNIKNANTNRAKYIFELQWKYRLALSGTPIENNIMELRSVFNFLMPWFLWTQNSFKERYLKWDKSNLNFLSAKIKPFILRRTKENVLKDLPPKVEETIFLQMQDKQKEFYTRLKKTYKNEIIQKIDTDGFNKSQFMVLDAMLKLRQVCLMPKLVKLQWNNITESIKLKYIKENVDEMIQKWHNLLIFSQFTWFLKYIKEILDNKNISYNYLDGQTRPKDRQKLVKSFNAWEVNVFVISLKAWWTGLNLVAADYVLHLDPRRNPAVEAQATDRAHRIGQTKTVFVQKLIVKDSIEEKILQLQSQKKKLVDDIFSWNFTGKLTEQDVRGIFE